MGQDQTRTERPSAAERPQESGAAALGRGGRMSRQRKRDAVLRLLRGEDLEMVSRSLGVTAATLSGWRDAFLAAGEASLSSRPTDGEALESGRLKARLGEMLLERELLEAKIALLGARPGPLARRTQKLPGNIACDAESRSELVVPLIRDGVAVGVMDLDSPRLSRFDEIDQVGIERVARLLPRREHLLAPAGGLTG